MHLRSSFQYLLPYSESLLQVLYRGEKQTNQHHTFLLLFYGWKDMEKISHHKPSKSTAAEQKHYSYFITHQQCETWEVNGKQHFWSWTHVKNYPSKPSAGFFFKLAKWKNNNFESITNTPVDSLAPADLIFQGANCCKVKVLSTSQEDTERIICSESSF